MARQVIERMVDDFDSAVEADEAIPFAVDGFIYVIDLTTVNAKEFRAALAPYVDAAHEKKKWPKSTRPKDATPPPAVAAKPSRTEIRAWAIDNGYEVKGRGQLPAAVMEAFNNR